MKVKTSVTLSQEVLKEVDELAKSSSRSEVIEQVLREYLTARRRAERDARDIEIMNRYADEYNRETEEFLSLVPGIDFGE
jgi:metal-responsive CopG/Arc/MetJ family transcriptional regulator